MKERIDYIIIILGDVNRIVGEDSFAQLGFDSLDFMEFVIEVENEFDIKIDDNEVSNQMTIQSFYELVEKLLK